MRRTILSVFGCLVLSFGLGIGACNADDPVSTEKHRENMQSASQHLPNVADKYQQVSEKAKQQANQAAGDSINLSGAYVQNKTVIDSVDSVIESLAEGKQGANFAAETEFLDFDFTSEGGNYLYKSGKGEIAASVFGNNPKGRLTTPGIYKTVTYAMAGTISDHCTVNKVRNEPTRTEAASSPENNILAINFEAVNTEALPQLDDDLVETIKERAGSSDIIGRRDDSTEVLLNFSTGTVTFAVESSEESAFEVTFDPGCRSFDRRAVIADAVFLYNLIRNAHFFEGENLFSKDSDLNTYALWTPNPTVKLASMTPENLVVWFQPKQDVSYDLRSVTIGDQTFGNEAVEALDNKLDTEPVALASPGFWDAIALVMYCADNYPDEGFQLCLLAGPAIVDNSGDGPTEVPGSLSIAPSDGDKVFEVPFTLSFPTLSFPEMSEGTVSLQPGDEKEFMAELENTGGEVEFNLGEPQAEQTTSVAAKTDGTTLKFRADQDVEPGEYEFTVPALVDGIVVAKATVTVDVERRFLFEFTLNLTSESFEQDSNGVAYLGVSSGDTATVTVDVEPRDDAPVEIDQLTAGFNPDEIKLWSAEKGQFVQARPERQQILAEQIMTERVSNNSIAVTAGEITLDTPVLFPLYFNAESVDGGMGVSKTALIANPTGDIILNPEDDLPTLSCTSGGCCGTIDDGTFTTDPNDPDCANVSLTSLCCSDAIGSVSNCPDGGGDCD